MMAPQQIDRDQRSLQSPLNDLNFLLQSEDCNSKGDMMSFVLFCSYVVQYSDSVLYVVLYVILHVVYNIMTRKREKQTGRCMKNFTGALKGGKWEVLFLAIIFNI